MHSTGTNSGQSGLDLSQELAAIISEDERELDTPYRTTSGQGERDDLTAGGSSGSCATRPNSPAKVESGAGDTADMLSVDSSLEERISKRARGPAEGGPDIPNALASNPGMVRAMARVRKAFGTNWQSKFSGTHTLVYAHPVLYCSRCGHHAATLQHATSLTLQCKGSPHKGSPMISRLRDLRIREQHPVTKLRLEEAYVVKPRTSTGDG